jgi:hypothetical protein
LASLAFVLVNPFDWLDRGAGKFIDAAKSLHSSLQLGDNVGSGRSDAIIDGTFKDRNQQRGKKDPFY